MKDIILYDAFLKKALNETGFQSAEASCLKTKLQDIIPRYATAYRDAAKEGNRRLLMMYEAFKKNNVEDQYQFVHVVLTDGQDNFSKISFPDFITHMTEMKKQVGQKFKCYFIGLDLESDYNTKRELKKIASTYGPNGKFFEIDDAGIEDIFLKVLEENHIKWQPTEYTSNIQENQEIYTAKGYAEQTKKLTRLKYVVVFTLDCSYSMFGLKWTQVYSSVVGFVNKLQAEDYVLGIVFNTGHTILTDIDIQEWNQVTYDDDGNRQGTFTKLQQQSLNPIYGGYQASNLQMQPNTQSQFQQTSTMQYQSTNYQYQQQQQQYQQQYQQQQQQQQIKYNNNRQQVQTSNESQCCGLI